MELFKLFGTIAVNNKDANSAIDETSEKAEGFGSKLKKGVSTVAKWGTAVVGGATAAAGALVKFAESSASTADHVDKMSQKIGISRQAYQELDFICSQSGTSVDSLQAGMKSLVSAMDGAASGTASNVEQFNKLGVSVTNADGSLRSSEEVMWETLSALQSMDNETEKARLATELFGRSGTELLPLLNSESGSLEEMKQQAHDLGLVLDDELIDSGVSLTDTIDQMKRSFGSIVTQLGASLMPIVENVSKYVIDNMPKIHSLFTKLEPIITGLLDGLLPPLMDLAEQLLPIIFDLIEQLLPPITQIISGVLPIITNLLTTLLPPLIQIVQILLPPLMNIINKLLPVVTRIIEAILPVLTSYLDYVMAILEAFMPIFDPIFDLLLLLLEPLLQLIEIILPGMSVLLSGVAEVIDTVVKPIITWVAEFLSGIFSGTLEAIQNLIGKVKDAFKEAWQGIKEAWQVASDFFSEIWESIKNAFSAVADWFKNIFSNAWENIKNVFSKVGEFFGNIWNTIKDKFSAIGTKIGDAISSSVKKGINGVLSMIENVINKGIRLINGAIGLINKIPGVNIGTIGLVSFPRLARGGVLKRGQVGLLEGDGAEAVVPLEKNTEWTLQVAKQIFEYSENKDKEKSKDTVINISLSIEKFVNEREQDLNELVETISEMLAAQIRRKELSF